MIISHIAGLHKQGRLLISGNAKHKKGRRKGADPLDPNSCDNKPT